MLEFVIVSIVKVVVVFAVLMGMVAYSTLLERRLLGRIQVRPGPNRVGPFGLLQPISDGVKLFFKEDIIPANVDRIVYVLAPAISIATAIAVVAVVPFGGTVHLFGRDIPLGIADINVALLYILGLAGLGEYGVMLGGWSSNNKYGLLGSLRTSAQMISYELAMGLTLVSVIMVSGSLSLRTIVDAQTGMWNIFRQPVAFILFLICGLAEINRTPFDMPEAESELACGFNIEYSSMKFAMFFMGEYAHMIVLAAITTCLFLGGWHGPFGIGGPGVIWFLLKLFCVVFFFIWERGTFPRLRYDQVMRLGWKFLMPVALLNLLGTGLYYTLVA